MACRLHMYYRLVPAELAPSDAQGEMVLVDTEGFQELPPQPHLHQQPLVLWLSSWQKDLGPSLHTGCSCSRSSSAVQHTVLATERNQQHKPGRRSRDRAWMCWDDFHYSLRHYSMKNDKGLTSTLPQIFCRHPHQSNHNEKPSPSILEHWTVPHYSENSFV